jgi:WD40 repeat protein
MTAGRRFEQELPEALADLAMAPYPDYIEQVLVITARTPRRPAWRFPARWLPVEPSLPTGLLRFGPRLRPVLVLVAIALVLLALAIAYVGSQRRLPDPFGPAANGVVAFSADDALYVTQLDGATRVLFDGPGSEYGPTFSLDGTKIAFIRRLNEKEYLWAVNADGSDQIKLIEPPIEEGVGLAWSPSGTEIAVSYRIDGLRRIVIVRADGSGSQLLDLGFEAADPAWRPPDGRELLVRRLGRGTAELYVIAADGSSARPLGVRGRGLFDGRWDSGGAAWSSDGSHIAYHTVDGGPDSERFRVHIVRADGTDDRVLSASGTMFQEAWPVWSPDGTRIAIQRWLWDGDSRIAVLPVDGSKDGPSIGPKHRFEPNVGWTTIWAPDGSRLLVFWDESTTAYSIDPVTGDVEQVPWSLTSRPGWQRVSP